VFSKKPPGPPTRSPSEGDLSSALEQLRRPGALCYLDLISTNAGISAEISFNQVRVQLAAGTLEVALREADLDFASNHSDAEWIWSADLAETARSLVGSTTQTQGTVEAASLSKSRGGETKGQVVSKAGFGLFTLEGTASHSAVGRLDARRDSSRSDSETTVRMEAQLRMSRPAGNPRLQFTCHPFEDLVPLNAHFARVPIFEYGHPERCRAKDMQVTLKLNLDYELGTVRHAFAIKRASGDWADLTADASKKMLAELLVSKFLVPLHDDQLLWPKEGANGG